MNESIVIHFFHENDPVEITSASHEDGIVFANEISAYPIKGRVSVSPVESNDIAKFHLKGIRQIEDWQPPAFFVAIKRDGNTLRISGGGTRQPDRNLPPIGYRLAAHVDDVKFKISETDFRLKEGESKELRVTILEPRQFKLVDVSLFDQDTLTILQHAKSRIDDLSPFDWFNRSVVRSARKVCLLNCLAKLRALPSPTEPLSRHIESVAFVDIDRIAVFAKPGLLPQLTALSNQENPVFRLDSGPLHQTHERLKKKLLGESAEHYELKSFRENVGHISLQIIVPVPKRAIENPVCYAEVDIDLFNPFVDLISFGGHVGELVDSGKTNHFDLFDDVPADFRYYNLA